MQNPISEIKPQRLVFALFAILCVFTLLIDGYWLSQQRNLLYSQIEKRIRDELALLADMADDKDGTAGVDELRKRLSSWLSRHEEIKYLKAMLDDREIVFEARSDQKCLEPLHITEALPFGANNSLTFRVQHDSCSVQTQWRQLVVKHISTSIALIVILATCIWFVVQSTAIKPMRKLLLVVRDMNQTLEEKIIQRTREFEESNESLEQEVEEKKQIQEALRRELILNESLASLSRSLISSTADIAAVANMVMEKAMELTGSVHGFISIIDPDTKENIVLNLSEMVEGQCRMKGGDNDLVFSVFNPRHDSGLLAHSLKTEMPFVSNTPDEHVSSNGLPEGHVPIEQFLSMPVKLNSQPVGQIALANPGRDYTDSDILMTERLADIYALAINRHRNIAEKEKLVGDLRQTQKMEAIGTLAGGIAHDFNNILTAILGNAQVARLKIDKESEAYARLGEVIKAGARASELIRQILTFSRRHESEKLPVMVSVIAKETLKFLRATIPTTITIRNEIDSQSGSILGDPTEIHQVLLNLCTNALHAMEEKGGVLNVILHDMDIDAGDTGEAFELEPGPYLYISVSDSGHGIDPSLRLKIFEPYFTTKDSEKGSGIGLAVVQGIVKNMNGVIYFDSEVGKGTTFHIFLPRVVAKAKDERCDADQQVPTGNERILLIDDEETVLQSSEMLLSSLGYTIFARSSAVVALREFLSEPFKFDLIITDQTMPRLTGSDFARQALAVRSDMPIILSTGYSNQIDEIMALEIGIQSFLMKPYADGQLAREVRAVLDKTKSTAEAATH